MKWTRKEKEQRIRIKSGYEPIEEVIPSQFDLRLPAVKLKPLGVIKG